MATVGIFMIVIVGMAVLGVDVGRLAYTATETQTVADAGAVAYAKTMLDNEILGSGDDPHVAADLVVAENAIDGRSASEASVEYAVGSFDFKERFFRPGGFPANAVKATGRVSVDNFFAGAFGDGKSQVKRAAVAAYGGAGQGRPTLPIAVGDCHFRRFERSDNCSDLPRLTQIPDTTDNSCWTSLRPTGANASELRDLLPAECCQGGQCGGGAMPPLIAVGDQVNVLNGSVTTLINLLDDCIDQGIREFVIPIVECGKCNQSAGVVGFARVTMTKGTGKGGKNKKGFDIEALCRSEGEGGAPGVGGNYGMKTLALVE